MTISRPPRPGDAPPTADEALAALDPDLVSRLAALADAPASAAEMAISLLPYGYRAVLETYELIDTTHPVSGRSDRAEQNDPRQRVHLTPLGRTILAACADLASQRRAPDDLTDRAERLTIRYGGQVPFETTRARS